VVVVSHGELTAEVCSWLTIIVDRKANAELTVALFTEDVVVAKKKAAKKAAPKKAAKKKAAKKTAKKKTAKKK